VPTEAQPRRDDVWLTAFGPSIGGETQKTRPALIVSNDAANAILNRVQVVPISSQVDRLYPAEAYISLAGQRRKAMADQITPQPASIVCSGGSVPSVKRIWRPWTASSAFN
jgi:mRNA-degrading endonuclease toxin of MazEF toxin-antitoxin module